MSDRRGRLVQALLALGYVTQIPRLAAQPIPRFHSSPEVIRLVVLLYVRFPLSLRNVETLLFARAST